MERLKNDPNTERLMLSYGLFRIGPMFKSFRNYVILQQLQQQQIGSFTIPHLSFVQTSLNKRKRCASCLILDISHGKGTNYGTT
jgi:hypothetical protein